MGWRILGWILVLWGTGGIIANIVYAAVAGAFPPSLIGSSLVSILFIWGGWKLAHRQRTPTVGQF